MSGPQPGEKIGFSGSEAFASESEGGGEFFEFLTITFLQVLDQSTVGRVEPYAALIVVAANTFYAPVYQEPSQVSQRCAVRHDVIANQTRPLWDKVLQNAADSSFDQSR